MNPTPVYRGDRDGTLLWSDVVVVQAQGGHDRVDLQCLRDRDGTLIPNAVDAQEESGHCIKAAHHALLMLDAVLALELLAHRVAKLQHVRRWEVRRKQRAQLERGVVLVVTRRVTGQWESGRK